MQIPHTISFVLEKRKNAETGSVKPDALIKLRVRYSMGIIDLSTGYKATVDKWVQESQQCKASTTHGKKRVPAHEINGELSRFRTLAEDTFKAFEVAEIVPARDDFKKAFNLANGKQIAPEAVETNKKTFFDYFDEFCRENGRLNDWTDATHQKFDALKGHLQRFRPNLEFSDLNEAGLSSFIDYLRSIPIANRKRKDNASEQLVGMRNSTIGKQLGFLKWFLRWASTKGYNTNNAFLDFHPKLKTSEKAIIFLTWEELMHFNSFEFPESKKYLERVRDVFCFCCFTSLRYSDAYNLRRSNINGDVMEITTIKTADKLIIELNNYALAILDKYKDVPFPDDKALPVISNQRMNDYLKEAGELAGIDTPVSTIYFIRNRRVEETYPKYELLGTHAGRRTFICNALALGIPADVVMKWTGHSDYKAMRPYIDIADTVKKNMMDKFNKR
jgi:integrase